MLKGWMLACESVNAVKEEVLSGLQRILLLALPAVTCSSAGQTWVCTHVKWPFVETNVSRGARQNVCLYGQWLIYVHNKRGATAITHNCACKVSVLKHNYAHFSIKLVCLHRLLSISLIR